MTDTEATTKMKMTLLGVTWWPKDREFPEVIYAPPGMEFIGKHPGNTRQSAHDLEWRRQVDSWTEISETMKTLQKV